MQRLYCLHTPSKPAAFPPRFNLVQPSTGGVHGSFLKGCIQGNGGVSRHDLWFLLSVENPLLRTSVHRTARVHLAAGQASELIWTPEAVQMKSVGPFEFHPYVSPHSVLFLASTLPVLA